MLPYDESADTYRGDDMYNSNAKEWTTRNRADSSVSITISRIISNQRSGRLSSSSRVTRDPRQSGYWMGEQDDEDEEDERLAEEQFGAQMDNDPGGEKSYAIPPKTKEALARPIFVDFGETSLAK